MAVPIAIATATIPATAHVRLTCGSLRAAAITSLDFSPQGLHLYYVSDKLLYGKRYVNFSRVNLTTAVHETIYTDASANPASEVRRFVNGKMYLAGYIKNKLVVVSSSDDAYSMSTETVFSTSGPLTLQAYLPDFPITVDDGLLLTAGVSERILKKKVYELTDHLGNVRAVVSDAKHVSIATGGIPIDFTPIMEAGNNYYPFGMTMPGRNFTGDGYRFGFNGMEKDDEVKGSGNSYTTPFRQYDPRIARWASNDLIDKPWESSYAGFSNNPIFYADPSGLDPVDQKTANSGGGKKGDTYTDDNDRVFEKTEHGWIEQTGNSDSTNDPTANTPSTSRGDENALLNQISDFMWDLDRKFERLTMGDSKFTFGIEFNTEDGIWNGNTANPVDRWHFDYVITKNWDNIADANLALRQANRTISYKINKNMIEYGGEKLDELNKTFDPTANAYKPKVTTDKEVKQKVEVRKEQVMGKNWIVAPEDTIYKFGNGALSINKFSLQVPLDSFGNPGADTLYIKWD